MKNKMLQQFQKLNQYYDYIFGVLILFVVLNLRASNVILGLLGVVFLLDIKNSFSKIKLLVRNRAFLILMFFIAYIYIHALIFDDWSGKRFRFFLILPSILLLSFRITEQVRALLAFVISVCIVSILGIFNIVGWYLDTGVFNMTSGGMIDKLLILNRPYLGFCLVIGSILSVYLTTVYKKYAVYLWCISVFFISYIYLISARISFVSLLVVVLLYLFFYNKAKSIVKILIFISLVGAVGVAITLNQDLSQRFRFIDTLFTKSEQLKNSEPRIIIWDCALKIAKSENFNPILGLESLEQLEEQLVDCYALDKGNDERRAYFLKVKFNTHNQFLDVYLTLGIVGVFLFGCFLIQLFFQKRHMFFQVAMLCTLVLFCFVENMFYVQRGIYLFAIVISFVMIMKTSSSKIESKLG